MPNGDDPFVAGREESGSSSSPEMAGMEKERTLCSRDGGGKDSVCFIPSLWSSGTSSPSSSVWHRAYIIS